MTANHLIIIGCMIVAVCSVGTILGGIMVKKGYAQKYGGQSAPSVHQQTSGPNSPNINAPNAKEIHVNYGIPERVISEWLKQLKGEKGKDKVIEYLLDDLKQKNVTITVMQGQIEDGLKMRKELETRSAQTSSTQAKTAPLSRFTHQEFIDNFGIFRSYYQYKKTIELLNPQMLIELLNVYFRSVLLYPSPDTKKYYITATDGPQRGALLLLQLEGHNERGEKTSISLPELSQSLLRDVCTDFIKSAAPENYEALLTLFDRALSTPGLDKVQKANILDAQAFIKKNKLFHG